MKLLSLLSGGLDSICWTAEFLKDHQVLGIGINYGQKNRFELDVARTFCEDIFKIPFKIWQSHFGEMGVNQITEPSVEVTKEYNPSIILPLRNGVFLMRALAYAYAFGFDGVLIGAQTDSVKTFTHEDHDEQKFPDESTSFLSLLERVASLGVFSCQPQVRIMAPIMKGMSKTDLIKSGYRLLGKHIYMTHSCRNADPKHCGKCEACIGRQHAFQKAGIPDQTPYA